MLAVHYMFEQLYITNITEPFSFESGRAVWVAELIIQD